VNLRQYPVYTLNSVSVVYQQQKKKKKKKKFEKCSNWNATACSTHLTWPKCIWWLLY